MLDLSKGKFLFLLFFSFIFLVGTSLVSAQPFDTETQSDGLRVLGPQNFPVEYNTGFNFTFHVVNVTSGEKVQPTDVTCNFFLYGKSGENLFKKDNITRAGAYFFVFLNSKNFTTMDEHDYVTSCSAKDTDLGGSVRTTFEVTANGEKSVPFPNEFFILIISLIFIIVSYASDRLSLFRYAGSIAMMVTGVAILYPGYNFSNHSTIEGLTLGIISICIGFYFLIEDAFSRNKQATKYGEKDEEEEVNEDLFEED